MPTSRNLPPKIKIYEALGAIADERVEIDGILAYQGTVHSASTKGKSYTISYAPETNSIKSNDSGSVNQWYIGYPAIAFLLKIWKLNYNSEILPMLEHIDRSRIKQQVNKHHEETRRVLLGKLFQQWYDVDILVNECDSIYQQLEDMKLNQ